MSAILKIETIGTFKKLRDMSAQVDVQPELLNEDPKLYGQLENPLDVSCPGFHDEGYGDLYFSSFDYIKKTSKQGTPLKQAIAADFFSTRRNLCKFAESSFEGRTRDEIRALRKKGVIFLCDRKSENETANNGDGGGYKFGQYMVLNEHGDPYRGDEEVSNAECVKSVIRTTLTSGNEEIKVFYAAEVDVKDKNGLFGEIKTFSTDRWIENKSLNNYLQSYLGNVSFIIKGQRDGNHVKQVERLNTNDIPKMKGVEWKPRDCKDRLYEVLREIKRRLKNDNEALIININGKRVSYRQESAANCHFVDQAFLDYFS